MCDTTYSCLHELSGRECEESWGRRADYISTEKGENTSPESEASTPGATTATPSVNPSEEDTSKTPAYDFTLVDQYGNEHTLSDYKGKIVFLNFWATWCPPCKKEIPDIEDLYQEYDQNQGDVIILGVANPSNADFPNNQDSSKEDIKAFLEENEYTFPVVFDETGDILSQYYISAFPTTFMIDKEGNVFGYVKGELTKDMIYNFIQQTLDSTQ